MGNIFTRAGLVGSTAQKLADDERQRHLNMNIQQRRALSEANMARKIVERKEAMDSSPFYRPQLGATGQPQPVAPQAPAPESQVVPTRPGPPGARMPAPGPPRSAAPPVPRADVPAPVSGPPAMPSQAAPVAPPGASVMPGAAHVGPPGGRWDYVAPQPLRPSQTVPVLPTGATVPRGPVAPPGAGVMPSIVAAPQVGPPGAAMPASQGNVPFPAPPIGRPPPAMNPYSMAPAGTPLGVQGSPRDYMGAENQSTPNYIRGGPEGFVDYMEGSPALEEASRKIGVPPQWIMAQSALETGWGEHMVGNNLFGIKAMGKYKGPSVNAQTREVVNGADQRGPANFRAYPNFEKSIEDYGNLIAGSSRYKKALGARTPEEYFQAIEDAGYATDPNYAEKAVEVLAQMGYSGQGNQAEVDPVTGAAPSAGVRTPTAATLRTDVEGFFDRWTSLGGAALGALKDLDRRLGRSLHEYKDYLLASPEDKAQNDAQRAFAQAKDDEARSKVLQDLSEKWFPGAGTAEADAVVPREDPKFDAKTMDPGYVAPEAAGAQPPKRLEALARNLQVRDPAAVRNVLQMDQHLGFMMDVAASAVASGRAVSLEALNSIAGQRVSLRQGMVGAYLDNAITLRDAPGAAKYLSDMLGADVNVGLSQDGSKYDLRVGGAVHSSHGSIDQLLSRMKVMGDKDFAATVSATKQKQQEMQYKLYADIAQIKFKGQVDAQIEWLKSQLGGNWKTKTLGNINTADPITMLYDENAPSKRLYFDAQGNEVNPADARVTPALSG